MQTRLHTYALLSNYTLHLSRIGGTNSVSHGFNVMASTSRDAARKGAPGVSRRTEDVFGTAAVEAAGIKAPELVYPGFVPASKGGVVPDGGDGRPLFEVLQKAREEKQRLYDETHNPIRPPRALDDDEVQFLDAVEDDVRAKDREAEEMEQDELELFMLSRKNMVRKASDVSMISFPQLPQKVDEQHVSKPGELVRSRIIAKKRKARTDVPMKHAVHQVERNQQSEPATVSVAPGLPGLVSYASSSSEASDGDETTEREV